MPDVYLCVVIDNAITHTRAIATSREHINGAAVADVANAFAIAFAVATATSGVAVATSSANSAQTLAANC